MAVGGGGISALSPSTSLAVATLVSPGQTAWVRNPAIVGIRCGNLGEVLSPLLYSGLSLSNEGKDNVYFI